MVVKCQMACCMVSEDRKQAIKESVEAGRGKSMFDEDAPSFGAQCRCGIPRKPAGLAVHAQDDGLCVVHPDQPPQPWVRGVEK